MQGSAERAVQSAHACTPHLPSMSTQMPARFSACCCCSPWLLSRAPRRSAISRRTFSAYSLGSAASYMPCKVRHREAPCHLVPLQVPGQPAVVCIPGHLHANGMQPRSMQHQAALPPASERWGLRHENPYLWAGHVGRQDLDVQVVNELRLQPRKVPQRAGHASPAHVEVPAWRRNATSGRCAPQNRICTSDYHWMPQFCSTSRNRRSQKAGEQHIGMLSNAGLSERGTAAPGAVVQQHGQHGAPAHECARGECEQAAGVLAGALWCQRQQREPARGTSPKPSSLIARRHIPCHGTVTRTPA
jgi:hypothetical protein